MRQPVVVAVPSCSSPLPSARRYVAVRILSGETLFFDVEVKGKVKDLYAAVVQNMSSLGMKSAELFGLAVCLDNEYLFVDPDNKLGKYAPKAWKASHTSGLDNSGNLLLFFYFRVQFYVDSHHLIRDRVTRRHYYLQLRENVLRHGQPASEESFFLLAALALQSDLGDFNEEHCGVYFNPHLYFPAWILERVGEDYVVQNIPAMHRDHQGLSRGSAELAYIKEASSGEAHHGLHLYRLRHSKKSDNNRSLDRSRSVERPNNSTVSTTTSSSSSAAAERLGNERNTLRRSRESRSTEREREERVSNLNGTSSTNGGGSAGEGSPRAAGHENATEGNVWLGICARGIDIYEEGDTVTKSLRASFLWPNIGKLCFERKKFEIRAVGCPDTRKFTYYTSSDDKSKHLLYLCRVTHQFSMAMQPRLAELRKLEEEAHRHYRESCFPNETSALDWPPEPSSVTLAQLQSQRMSLRSLRCYTSLGQSGRVHNDQRISVISNTSSNTTSGIVSDKVQSVDESEDDLEVEIMINAPPAPSLESLALAHLRDNGSSCDSLPKEAHGPERNKEERESNGILPRKLAGLARLARVGRKSGTSGTSHQESVDHSRAGSLQSSSSQYSASTIHSRSRSKSRLGTWGRNTTSTWLYDTDKPKESVDIVDGINSMVLSDVRKAVSELRTANDFNSTLEAKRTNVNLENGVQSANTMDSEEPQYWYSCDDDASETCSTADNCAGATCAECRLVRVGSQHDCCSSPTQVLRHDTGPSGISMSSTSSLCVSVDHTAQNSTLSDCHSVFHSYVSSMDSNGPNVSSHELEEEDEEVNEPEPAETAQTAESPLTATVSAVRSPSPLSQRQRPTTCKRSNDNEPNYVDFYPNSLSDSAPSTPASSPVDYSVRSGSLTTTTLAPETAGETLSPSKLDFTVTSAVPNTGTYSRRSTVSHTLDTDSDYVQLPPLEAPLQLNSNHSEGLAKSISMSNIVAQIPPSPEKRGGAGASLSKNPKLIVPSAAAVVMANATPTGSNSNTLPKTYRNHVSTPSSAATLSTEALARFITSKPPISVLQAHATPANTSSPSFAIMTSSPPNTSPAMTPSIPTEQYLPPPPYDPRVYLPATTSASMTPSNNQSILTHSDAFFNHQSQPILSLYGVPQVEPPPPLYPAALHAFNHLQLIEQSLDPALLQAVSASAVSSPLSNSNPHLGSRNTTSKTGAGTHVNTLPKSSSSSTPASQVSNYGQMATAYPAFAEDISSSSSSHYSPKDSNGNSTAKTNSMAPVISKNNYLDIHASNTLSRRPPHPLPQEVLAAQHANLAHAQTLAQSSNHDAHLAAQARIISLPEEDQYLGIPPPPQYPGKPSLATVYTNQVTQSQIEQFKAQLYSDVDYVIYPLKDPALSRQEYMDAKQGAMLAQAQSLASLAEMESAAYLPPPPPYRAPKTANLYRSAPNVFAATAQLSSPAASLSNLASPQMALPVNKVLNGPAMAAVNYNLNPHQTHYASNQSLSSSNYSSSYSTSNYSSNYSAHQPMTYVPYPSMNAKYLSTQSLASSHSSNPSGYSASTQSLTGSYEPIGEDYLARLRAARNLLHPTFPRVQSEESILSYDTGVGHDSIVSSATQNSRYTTTGLPPPPPYRKQSLDTPHSAVTSRSNSITASEHSSRAVSRLSLDIKTLREKSKNLDLPLISALCNDPALLNANRKPPGNGSNPSQTSTPNTTLQRNSNGKLQDSAQQQQQSTPVANIQSMPLPPTPLEALQGKTQGQPVARQQPQPVASKAYVMPKHPTGSMTVQPESAVPRRLAMNSRSKASHHQTRPLSWHSDNVNKAWSAVNGSVDGLSVAVAQPVQTMTESNSSSQSMSYMTENLPSHQQHLQQQPPPLPPPNPGSVAEAKLKAIHLLANSEDGSKKPLHLVSLTKAVKNSYTVSPNRKYPVSGLYAVSELGKSSGLRKVSPAAFSHPHGQDMSVKMSLNVNNAQPQTKGAMTAISNGKAVPNKYSEGRM